MDTVAPTAPVLVSDSVVNTNQVSLSGTAEANSAIKVYDGTAVVGTTTTDANGNWTATSSALTNGTHNLTATATDLAGNTSALSKPLAPVIGSSAPPSAPVIASFSNDSGKVGDGVTNDNTLTLTGTAAANSTVKVFDGSAQIGATTANSSGSWTYTTSALTDAKHVLTATATNSSGQTSAASSSLSVTVDTVAPTAPVLVSDPVVNTNQVSLSGTAEANSAIKVYDGTAVVGTTTTDANGNWTATSSALTNGTHNLTATATDLAGNTSALSKPLAPVIGSSATTTPTTGWPDSTNTGVPAGTTLTPSGDLVITQAGAVISGLDIKGTVYIAAPNVTLQNCKIAAASFAVVQIASGITGAVVQNCDINGLGNGHDNAKWDSRSRDIYRQ